MAKAGDKSSTIDWILLSVALELAVAALGSVKLAKKLLVEWMASGELPWTCIAWKGPVAEVIALVEQMNRMGKTYVPVASPAYRKGDPEFLRANPAIDWENNTAHDNALGGAEALGIKVSRTHLIALLPKGPRERAETPEPTKPEEREKLEPKAALLQPREREEAQGAGKWIAADIERMKKANKISPDITITELSRQLERRMTTAAERDKSIRPIKARSIENLLRVYGLWPISPSK